MIILLSLAYGLTGCETVDTSFDLSESRGSQNQRYDEDDIVGGVLKLKMKEPPAPSDESGLGEAQEQYLKETS